VAFRDGGAAAVGVVGLPRMLPAALLTPFASAVADRTRRERVSSESASSAPRRSAARPPSWPWTGP